MPLPRNPMDLRPLVDKIVWSIEARLENLPENKTLFVGMGEDHANALHTALIQLTLRTLKKHGHKIAFGYEEPENAHGSIIGGLLKAPDARALADKLAIDNIPLLAYLAWEGNDGDPGVMARHNLMSYCLRHFISTRFNDAVRKYDPALGTYVVEGTRSRLMSVEGMEQRNIRMAENAIRHAKQEQARIYVYGTGGYHLAGGQCTGPLGKDQYNPFHGSQMAAFRAAGERMIGILPTTAHYNEEHLPQDAAGHVMVVGGVPEFAFYKGQHDKDSAECLLQLRTSTKGAFAIYNLNDEHRDCLRIVKQHGAEWLDGARAPTITHG